MDNLHICCFLKRLKMNKEAGDRPFKKVPTNGWSFQLAGCAHNYDYGFNTFLIRGLVTKRSV